MTRLNKEDFGENMEVLSELSLSDNKSTYSVTKPNSEIFHALLNFTKSFIGIGALTIASAMKNAGVFLGLLGISVVGLLCLYGVNIMVLTRRKILKDKARLDGRNYYLPEVPEHEGSDASNASFDEQDYRNSLDSRTFTDRVIHDRHKIKTYSDLGRETYGLPGYYAVVFVIFVQQLTIVTAYFYFLDRYFPSYVVLIGITPIWMFWDLKKISYVSFFSLSLVTTVLMVTISVSIANITDTSKENLKYADFLGFPMFFGIWVFQFEGNTSCLQIENSMRSPKKFKLVSSLGIAIVVILKSLLALFAYLWFVDSTEGIIIDSLPGNTLQDILGFMYWGAIVGSMPIQLNPVSDTIYRMTFCDKYSQLFRENPTTKYYAGALVSILLCAGVALVIPSLELMLSITGSFMGIFTMTIFPVLFYNKAFAHQISTTRYVLHIGLCLITFATGMISIVITIRNQF